MVLIMKGLLIETWRLFAEMAPYLLFGFFIAGILHVIMPQEKIYRHLSANNLSSVVKASLFGIPLPLCSCGVIPVAAHLKKEGASDGATISFLISTPTTGVDSILATYSLLGPVFAIIRPVSAFFAGIFSGTITNITSGKKKISSPPGNFPCSLCDIDRSHSHGIIDKMKAMFKYGFVDLVEDTGKWLVIGVLAGGVIGYLVPSSIISRYLGRPEIAYPLMLLIGIPMYVCATGSIPIVASLLLKGMSPGAGLVFLFAGPATNTATLAFVGGKLGRKMLFIYLSSIIFSALLFGFIIDYIWGLSGKGMTVVTGSMKMLPYWVKAISGGLLIVLILSSIFKRTGNKTKRMGKMFKVPDMTCQHCVRTFENTLKKLDGVEKVNVSLKRKEVTVKGNVPDREIISAIKQAGYSGEKVQ